MIHEHLKEIYDEFDDYARISNVDYSIDADYSNVQGYRLLDCNNVSGFLRHIANFVKDKPVNFEYNGTKVNYDDLRNEGFAVSTYNPIFMFSLKPLQEQEMQLNERQLHFPHRKHTDKQAPHRASFRPNLPGFQYGKNKKIKKKNKKKKDSLANEEPFDNRLMDAINETVVMQVDPDILFTRDEANLEDEDAETALQNAIKNESIMLKKYLSILEKVDDENSVLVIEELAENCTANINKLNSLLKENF